MDVEIGIAVRARQGNPWLDRLIASLKAVPCGVPTVAVRIEEGPLLTKVEKMVRLHRIAREQRRMLCMIEDDAEVVHPGWLAEMANAMEESGAALVGPAEANPSVAPDVVASAAACGELSWSTNLPGFCMLVHPDAPGWDVRCQTLSDLWISLACRAEGRRLACTTRALLRHTKEPWARDTVPPWEQGDRSRFGAGDAYYARERHEAKRQREARLMLDTFGDLARGTLPAELLAAIEPGGAERVSTPGCSGCRRKLGAGERWVAGPDGARCFACAGVAEYVAPHVGGE